MLAARILDHGEIRKHLVDGVGRFHQELPAEVVTWVDKQTQAYMIHQWTQDLLMRLP